MCVCVSTVISLGILPSVREAKTRKRAAAIVATTTTFDPPGILLARILVKRQNVKSDDDGVCRRVNHDFSLRNRPLAREEGARRGVKTNASAFIARIVALTCLRGDH